ncbi:MAG: tetratricopeptide repeat protein [Ignavibacteria bacterium]|nr:tetratricopeptide repeat protein [Ignavibacteria bacterium]
MNIPSGNVTFLFTDIEGSTILSQQYPKTIQSALEIHHSIVKNAIESNNGFIFETVGDAFCSAFQDPEDAVIAAADAMLSLSAEKWKDAVIKIRAGIHSGIAEWSGKSYMGYITLARSARVMSAAYGGQIIMSVNTYNLIKDKFDKARKRKITYRDLGERRLKDVIQPLRLFQIAGPGLKEDFPPLKTLDARPNNLPVQLTSFIGRQNEIQNIKNLLASSRQITLIGTGGTGKTRLSLQVGAEVIDEYENGVWITEFAPLTEAGLIPVTIAKALNIKEQQGQNTEITLLNYLREKELILILDNCEHVINTCAEITEKLLKNCPRLKIIATSREALRTEGEVSVKVSSLTHPEPAQINSPLELSQYEAVRLFIERALSVSSGFRVTNENAPALAQICFQLDGIPLAIELAAARIKVLSVEKICDKLNDRFRLLTGGRRTALPRQQTLKAMIDWSYDLLTEKEKRLFSRLSVFSGGWTLEVAEEICSDDDIDIYELMDIHSNLVDKSLISSTEINGTFRFYLLESLKQYAKEKLDTGDDVHRKHFRFFKNIADHGKLKSKSMTVTGWIKLMDSEFDNIRAALKWASENEIDNAFDFANDLTEFWNVKGYFKEGLQSCEKLLSSGINAGELQKAKILYSAGMMEANSGNFTAAEDYAVKGLEISRRNGFRFETANCLNLHGISVNLNMDRIEEAKKYFKEAYDIFCECGCKKEKAVALYNMSFVLMNTGESEKGMNNKLEALKIYKELDETHQIATILANLGVIEYRKKNYETARSYTEESLSISYQIGDSFMISVNLINLGCIYTGLKEYDKALGFFEESLSISAENGYKSNYFPTLMYVGVLYADKGDHEKAVVYFKDSVIKSQETGIDYFLAITMFDMGKSLFQLKRYELSLKCFLAVKSITESRPNPISKESIDETDKYIDELKNFTGTDNYEIFLTNIRELSKDEFIKYVLSFE